MIKRNNLDLVEVEWIDAMSDDNTWQDLDELKQQELRTVHCCGWLLHADKDKTILISSIDETSQSGGGGTVIPTNCIVNITKQFNGDFQHEHEERQKNTIR